MSENPIIPKILLVTYLANDFNIDEPFLEENTNTLENIFGIRIVRDGTILIWVKIIFYLNLFRIINHFELDIFVFKELADNSHLITIFIVKR